MGRTFIIKEIIEDQVEEKKGCGCRFVIVIVIIAFIVLFVLPEL